MPLLCSKLSLPLLLRVKTRVPRWFFKALPKFTGHSSDISPTILPLTHTTQATQSPWESLSILCTPYWFLCLEDHSLPPSAPPVFPCVLQVFTQMSPSQLALPRPLYLKIATLILKLYSSSLYFSSQLFIFIYLFIVCPMSRGIFICYVH